MKISSNHADFKYDKILNFPLQDVETKYWFDWIKGFNSNVNNTVSPSPLLGIAFNFDKTNCGL